MIRFSIWTFVFLLLALKTIKANIRNPLKDPHLCGRPECDIENNKFAYQYNVRYKYDYRMHVRTEFAGSGHNSSDIFVSASVILTFSKNCQGVLSVQEIELREKPLGTESSTSDGKNTGDDDSSPSYDMYDYEVPETIDLHPRSDDFANNIHRNELRFAFHDGIIGEVCSAEDEDIWVLNLKKGILSAIQNTMKRFDIDYNTTETDVSGNCDVVYTLDGASGTSLSIVKSKNIASCTNRYKTNSILQTTPYDFRENYAVWPILKSESTCNISIDHNVYQSVTCYERHQLVPFSNNQSGAVTESKISMTLADEETFEVSPYEELAEIENRSPLLFNHYPSPKPTHGEIKASRDLLREMCRLGFPDIQREFIEVFTKFLQTARLLSYQALYQLLSRASSICTNGRNHVMESLPYIGSTSSVELMKDQIVKNQVTVDIAHKWLSSISLLPRLDVEMLQSFYSLIEYGHNKNDSMFILTSTAATHTFCRHNAACIKVKEAKKIIRYLEDKIVKELDNKLIDRQKRTKITVLLKGLGNIGVVTKSFEITLRTIIENGSLPMDIRLQAIQSHRRLDCLNSKEYFLDMYKNFTVNSEIRIAAYLQTMRCPDYISIKYIKHVLETEEVNQVGSYVWSHLNNLAKSASPVRVAAQGLLVDGDLGTKYKLDIRKFSRNFENSVFFDEYNFGGLSDANLIFGTESYLPRAASINLTADLFGESVNFFEASVRMQGFENLVQTYLGPNGPLTLAFKEKLRNASGMFSWLSWMVKDTVGSKADDDDDVDKYNYRLKRETHDIDPETDYSMGNNVSNKRVTAMSNNVKSLNYNLKYDFNRPRLAYGFKIFGNDIKYGTIEEVSEIFDTLNTFDPLTQIKNIFSGQEITYSKSGVFLDASYEVPLSVGLPLAIHALGASSVDIRMSGSLGSTNYLTTKQLDIEGKLKPSISVDVTATMKSDYFYGASGVRVKSNLYSSSSIESKVKVRGTRLISVQFSLPQDRNDLFSARSEMLVLTHERDIVQKGINKRYTNSTCTWPLVDKAVGLKICADYSLPDVSNGTGAYPSLILSGPIDINVHLSKADTTAKTYVFEYRWDDAVNVSRGSLIFETPGSTIPRIFMANITKDLTTYNVSMSFKNGDQIHSAVGTYKNTPNDKRFEIYFNINGQKNLALEMSLNRTEIKYGWVYYPRILITVNDERIAGLAGTLKATSKKSIYQYDVNLKFETKRLLTQISGYITLTDVSFTPKLKIDYLFLDNKPEAVEIDGEWSNRGHKTRTEYNGALIVKATAYPQFNFASNLKFLSLLGHVECKLDINNAPDLIDPDYTLTLRFIFARFHVNELRSEGSRTTTSIEIARPKSNIDFKFMIKHEEKFKTGPEHNVLFLLRFAPKREATAVVSVHLPRGTLFAIDAVVNITVPAFDSCAMALRLIEKSKNEYNIDFQGTWFSGHSMIIKGMYQDKSTVVKTYYHLKLMAKSPHFEETTVDVKYWRDETELTFDLQVFYAKQPFSFLIKHSEHSINEKILYTELKLREKIYSISANMSSHNPKQLIVELHIDKLRDVHLILRGLTSDSKKEVGIEIKWDANRDPTQKVAISADFNTPHYKMYDGNFLVAYPERTFSATFNLDAGGPDYRGNARLGWSSFESIDLTFYGGSNIDIAQDIYFNMQLSTPFDGWKHNEINGGVYYIDNLLLINGSAIWAESQNLAIAFMGDYHVEDPQFKCEIKLGLNSTIRDIPTINAHVKHLHDNKKFDSEVSIRHTPFGNATNVFSVRSIWYFEITEKQRNITGSIALRSPFAGYRTGALSTKFSLSEKKQIRGAADLDLEEKKFTLSVEGHVKKFTDNMLVTNITTPIEKFRNIIGRFGINEKERHIVMEVRGPLNALGVEILFAIQSVTDFNVKFNLETPLEAFEKIMIIGKIKPETIDFRGAWNKIMLGYIGVSRLASFNDFEYSSKVFTPIENFVENGFVAKFIKKEDFDLELSLKFAKYKLGIVINSKPKPKIMRQLGLKLTHELLNNLLDDDDIFKNHDNENIPPNDGDVAEYDNDDDDDDDDDEDYDPLSFIGYMELYTLIWPTITGTLDVEEIDDTYLSYGTLKLPNGTLELRDKFYYPDYFTMKNTLKILTPFSNVREIRNVYEHSIDLGNFYIIGLDVSVLNVSQWLASGFKFNYTTITDEAELKTHDVHLHIHTPLSVLPKIDLKSNIELEDSTYRANFSAATIDTKVSIGGSLESDENFLDVTAGLELYSPTVPKYIHKVYFKKDLSDIENTIDLGWKVWDNELCNNFHIETAWQLDKHNYVNVKGAIRNNIIGIKQLELLVYMIKSPNLVASIDFAYAIEEIPAALEKFHAKVSRKKEHVHCELTSTIQHIGNVSIQGSLSQIPGDLNGAHNLMGNLYRNSEVYTINGTVTLQSDIPIEIMLDLKSLQNETNSGAIEYSLKEVENGYGNIFKFNATNADKSIQIVGGYSLFNMINWKLILAVVTSNNVLSNQQDLNRMNLNTSISPTRDGFTLAQFKLNTPFTELGLESIQLSSVLNISQSSGNVRNSYELTPTTKGNSYCEWSWIIMENMLFMWDSVTENRDSLKRVFKTGIKYENPMRNMRELSVGAHLNVHDLWKFESKGSLTYLSKSDIGIGLAVRLPEPVGDHHIFSGRYRSETNAKDSNMDVNYELKYEAEEARTRLASRGLFRNATDMQSLLRFEWGQDIRFDAAEVNVQMLRKNQRRELSGRLVTPFHIEDTLLLTGAYDLRDIYQLYSGKINYPATRQIADGDIAYSSLSNVKGYVNTTTPFQNLTWLRGDFDFTTTGSQSTRFLKARWPKDTAIFDLKTTNSYVNFERDVQGIINIEAPLTTRHFVIIDYSLKERGPIVTGHANVEYNKKNVLKGMYKSKTEISTGHEKNVIDIALENDFKPIGVSYVHQREFSDTIGLPDYDMKRAEIYELRNSKLINITGEVHIKTTMTGQDYRIIAIHPNRTVIFTSNYDFKNQTTKHKSRLELATSVWFAYDLMLHNYTKDNNESQSYSLLFSYPKRNISTDGWYALTEHAFDSDISFQWTRNSKSDNDDDNDSYDNGYDDNLNDDNSPRVMRAALQWRNEPLEGDAKDNQTLVLTIRHPSFAKDVTFSGFYYKSPVDLFNSKLIVDYCDDLDHLLTLESVIRDLSTIVGYRNYTLLILGHHEISEFKLDVRGSIGSHLGLYETLNLAQYKRGYIPLQEGFLIGKIDLQQKEINYMKQTPYKTVRFYSKADGKFPVYTINGTVEDSPDINSTGQFYINIENKYIRLNINMTPDASQNLYMLGIVPDARSASFDLWRDYEDIRVVDVAYYLRMNHSRLVTSQLLWRPKLKMEFKEKIRGMAVSFYESLSENVDFWIKTLYTESMDTMNDLWRNAKPHTQRFLNDVGGLRVLEDDIEEFRIFLNQSYEANDFYVKTVVNFTLTIIDELAIRNHIGSVPKILSEVWHVLGDSGQALRRSILWLIDTIKTSYKKTLEIISKILHGESLEHISAIIEKAVARYDTFIKDLHLKLIKHVENMWATMADMLGNYWKRSLHRIEPSIIKFLHYIETMIWNISKEIFDFLYKRTNELIESPYFNKVSNFTQDLDRLYKDLMANDALTNIKKYAVLAWQFLKEKYFKVVPFGKEMHDVMSELFEEIKALKNLEIIKVINSKINEMQMKLDWFAENLQLDQRLIQLWDMIRNKITRIAQTALQADDKYREAKTKFIFDPDNGVMELEQKLPMSWHSFNETPKFEEIPEYKLLIDIQKYFNGNNFSIWNYYYEFKPFMDPNNWLPPFKSYALLIGSRHIVTFDKRFTSINFKYDLIDSNHKPAQCSYLLAHDFVDTNFTLILEPSIVKHNADLISTKKLALITENDLIDIDIVEFSVRVGKHLKSTLPIQIGDAVIYRDADMLMIESNKGFTLHCNLQFDFCWFELSGWYYGQTAGLFGTMNNEHFDEFTTSTNVIINDSNMANFIGNSDSTVTDNNNNMNEFINSWSFGSGCSPSSQTNNNIYNNNSFTPPIHIVNTCDSLFKNKLSYFANCFTIIDPQPFYKICLDLGTNSISNYIDVKHPAQKGTCTAALGYIEACAVENTPLRIPDSCVYCDLLNGTYVPEGTFMMLKDKDVPMTTDIVFIIEAKPCNADVSTNKNIMSLINVLNKELTDRNIKNNRYAVITFGGVSPFDKPRSVVYNGLIFTDHINIKHYFDHIMTGASNSSDIFEAISTATKLIFRLGTSKTFILMPCSACNSTNMRLDYSSMIQVLLEENINLHILMDEPFDLDKKRIERVFFGMDRQYVYTKKYLKEQIGDVDLRRQIVLPKKQLGVCTSLAIETNGTIFTSRKLRPGNRNPIKKFTSVFAKRIASTADPKQCQTCECTGHNTGIAYMTCTSCEIPNPWNLDYDFNENEMLSIMQSGTDFNWGDDYD